MYWQKYSTLSSRWLTSLFPWQRHECCVGRNGGRDGCWWRNWDKTQHHFWQSRFSARSTHTTDEMSYFSPARTLSWLRDDGALLVCWTRATKVEKKNVAKEETSLVGSCKHFIRPFVPRFHAQWKFARKRRWKDYQRAGRCGVLKNPACALPLNYSSVVRESSLGIQN